MRVGLFGGSFNPPHAGHIHASEIALRYLGLDAIWWLVTPGNPFKAKAGLPDIDTRIGNCRKLITNPKLIVTNLEQQLGTIRTYDTVRALKSHFPKTDFVWVSGTDIAYEFHKWHNWKSLLGMVPFAFVGRPTKYGVVRQNSIRLMSTAKHHFPLHGGRPALEKGQIYWLFAEPLMDISSTRLRQPVSPICGIPLNSVE